MHPEIDIDSTFAAGVRLMLEAGISAWEVAEWTSDALRRRETMRDEPPRAEPPPQDDPEGTGGVREPVSPRGPSPLTTAATA